MVMLCHPLNHHPLSALKRGNSSKSVDDLVVVFICVWYAYCSSSFESSSTRVRCFSALIEANIMMYNETTDDLRELTSNSVCKRESVMVIIVVNRIAGTICQET